MNHHDWILPNATQTTIHDWYAERACDVDQQTLSAHDGLRHAAAVGLLGLGIDEALGGNGGQREEMMEAIALIAGECMTSAFVLWCHRMLVSYIAHSDNAYLKGELFADVLAVKRFGATGLANAIKHAASMEELSVKAEVRGNQITLNGGIRWASNLVNDRFVVGVAAQVDDERAVLVAVPAEAAGVQAGKAYPLTGLGGTQSSYLRFENVTLDTQWIISDDLFGFINQVRPEFISLQSSLAWGLADAALTSIQQTPSANHPIIRERFAHLHAEYERLVADIRRLGRLTSWGTQEKYQGLKTRKEIAELAVQAVWLELEAAGGRGYMEKSSTSRRLRESAFLPVQSPSLIQLTTEIEQLEREVG